MKWSRILTGALFVLGSAGYAWADDLALIKIGSQAESDIATRILSHAYARSGNNFLVLVTSDLKDSLKSYNIPFEVVLRDASIRTACVVQSAARGRKTGVDLNTLGEGVPLGSDMLLMARPSVSAADARDRGEVFVIPLTDKNVFFHYEQTAAERLFSPMDVFPTDSLANLVNKDTMTAINKRLEAFSTRYIWADSNRAARQWIESKFASWGYTQISSPSFSYGGGTHYNVQVIKPGYAEPDQIIVIGGHYDTWNQQSDPMTYAPGSDDNGSGTALTMEVARVLANVPLRKTVIFMPFTAEEQGLIGSAVAASTFRATGAKVEAMLNYDMIGFTADSYWDLSMSSGSNTAYRSLCAQTAGRVSVLIPTVTSMGTSSDHYSFFEQGFDIVDNIETDFNSLGWHTNLDLTSRMNFDYMEQVVRMAVASVAVIADAGSPISISGIVDVGNGTDLDVSLSECNAGYQNWLYWGTSSGTYTDSVLVPPGECTYRVAGLTLGTTYYFGAFGKPTGGYRSIWSGEASERPLLVPRPPANLLADPGERTIILDWADNTEADFSHYNVYRRVEPSTVPQLLISGLSNSQFIDSLVAPGLKYSYRVTAVDLVGHESEWSNESGTYPATFDGGILVVDEFSQDYSYMADEAHQAAFFDTVLGFLPHGLTRIDSGGVKLDKGTAGRFSSVVWNDDDFFQKQLSENTSVLDWYLSHHVNMFISGIQTIQSWSPTPVSSSHLLSREFKVSSFYYNNFEIFNGAVGVNGWPSVQWGGVSRGLRYGSNIPALTVGPGGTVILTYDAQDNDPRFEGQPAGVAYDGPNGKRVIVGFPLYYLTPASATALMAKVKEFFGESAATIKPGDNNHDGIADLGDLTALVSYLTQSTPLSRPNGADVDHTCFVDLGDLSTLVHYLVNGAPALQEGCVNP